MKKLILGVVISIFFGGFWVAHASLVISEIMYDLEGADEGREWIEVYNSGPEAIDFSEYKFFEADTNHKLLLVSGISEIGSGGYAIIADKPEKFKNDWPSFSGSFFDSAFILSNTGESLVLKDGELNPVDSYFYSSAQGGAGDGKSLQKINGVWRASKPTPGSENIFFVPPPTSVAQKTIPRSDPKPVLEQDRSQGKTEEILPEPTPVLPAQAIEVIDEEAKNIILPIIAFVVLLGVSSITVYFLRRRKTSNNSVKTFADEFEIME